MKYWIDENEQKHHALPRIWNGTTPFNEFRANEAGWRLIEEPDPDPPEPITHYSKYRLKNACVSRGLWDGVRSAIENAGKWESFLLIQDISSDNPELLEVMPTLVQLFGEDLVGEVLNESIAD